MKSLLSIFVSFGFGISLFAQDSTRVKAPDVQLSGFIDVYYNYDFNKPDASKRLGFLYNHNRHNEFNINLALLRLDLAHEQYRAKIALQTGTYTNDNMANEPEVLRNIYEANVGLALNKQKNVWLDAGVMSSYIGFESAISSDNLTLSRSLLAENSPYFMTGAKLTYNPNAKWEMSGFVGNGWQRIQRLEGNSLPSFGSQLKYMPSENLTLNWSTFVGSEQPDATRKMRYFNNFYAQMALGDRWKCIAGFDIGAEQKRKGANSYNYWWSPTLIGCYALTNKWSIAGRAEHYDDRNEVIIVTKQPRGFATTGLSVNVDYRRVPNLLCRLEARWLQSQTSIMERNGQTVHDNFSLAASMVVLLK